MELITNPNAFFKELKQKDTRIKIPLLTIIIPLVILISIYQYFLVTMLSRTSLKSLLSYSLLEPTSE